MRALLKVFKECILAQRNLQHLGCWNCLEKLAEMFLFVFVSKPSHRTTKVQKAEGKVQTKKLVCQVAFQ